MDLRAPLALDLTPPLPSQLQVLDQWIAEPTRFIFLPASTFHSNAKGYPVLPKGTQSFVRDMMKVCKRCDNQTPLVIERMLPPDITECDTLWHERWKARERRGGGVCPVYSTSGENKSCGEGCAYRRNCRELRAWIPRLPTSSITGVCFLAFCDYTLIMNLRVISR